MDNSICWLNEKKIENVINELEKNNMSGYYAKTKEELVDKIQELVQEGATVACGGSKSLDEVGVMEHLKSGRYNFLDRYKEGLTAKEVKDVFFKSFGADAYFTSTNALTEAGELYNVDGNGNRVAAMLYGPEKVIVICGVNKIVKDVEAAIERNKKISAPANAKRLNKNTPCAKVGYCMDCKSEDRICNEYTLIKRQRTKGRIHVFILNENLGY